MLVSVLYIIAIGLNAYGIYLNLRYNKTPFDRLALPVLLCGMFHILSGYLIMRCYPQHLYLSNAFPISMLYGAAFYYVFKVSLGQHMTKKVLHMLPFLITFSGYIVMMLYAPWRYHFYHEFYIGAYVISLIMFVTYLLTVRLRYYAESDYCLKTFVNAEKKSFIPLFVVALAAGVMALWGGQGDVEVYMALNLTFYILVMFPFIKLSLLRTAVQEDIVEEAREHVTPSLSVITDTGHVITETKAPFFLSIDIELDYKLEIEKFIASKAYLDINLNKNSFCESVNIPKAHVSPFLKQVYGKNFNSFINEFRLAYAAKELSREELIYTIDELSYICGFRSRASFYRNEKMFFIFCYKTGVL